MNPADPFAPHQLFAIPFFSVRISDWGDHKQPLLDVIRAERARHPGVRKSNRGGWHSVTAHGSDDPHLRWVLDTVTRYARRALAPSYGNWAQVDLQMGTWWSNVLDQGGWNAPHHHIPHQWSGTYYVNVPEFERADGDMSGMLEFVNPNPADGGGNRAGNFAIAPRDGTIVLFPSSLVHFVHPYHGPGERISIAYNLNVVPK